MDFFPPGEHIENRYLVHDVRKSSTCVLYFCHDELFDKPVAIKTPQYGSPEQLKDLKESFVQGAKRWILAGKETGFVEAYDLFTISANDGKKIPYLVIEFIKGDPRSGNSLRGWIHDSRFDLRLKLYFAHTICSGMMRLQKKLGRPRANFVHLNLKPQNILVTHEGTLKITDIGLAEIAYKMAVQGQLISSSLKNQDDFQAFAAAKVILGTPPYMSPEQCVGRRAIDMRSDIYSFGCILYEMCTGRFVFEAKSAGEFIEKHIETPPVSPRKWDPGIPVTFERLIMKCLSKKPEERPSDFEEIREEIKGIMEIEEIPSGIEFFMFGFSSFTEKPRVKSDMNMTKELEAVILSKKCGVQYVIDLGLVKDREEFEALLARHKQLTNREKSVKEKESAENQMYRQVAELVRVGDALLRMAEESEESEPEKSARSAMSKYLSAHKLIPDDPQVNFRLAMAYRTLAEIIYDNNEALSDELINLTIKRYDAILAAKMKPAIAMINDTYFLLPFHALFQRSTAIAARGDFGGAVKDLQSLLTWLEGSDRSEFSPFFEQMEQEVTACLDALRPKS